MAGTLHAAVSLQAPHRGQAGPVLALSGGADAAGAAALRDDHSRSPRGAARAGAEHLSFIAGALAAGLAGSPDLLQAPSRWFGHVDDAVFGGCWALSGGASWRSGCGGPRGGGCRPSASSAFAFGLGLGLGLSLLGGICCVSQPWPRPRPPLNRGRDSTSVASYTNGSRGRRRAHLPLQSKREHVWMWRSGDSGLLYGVKESSENIEHLPPLRGVVGPEQIRERLRGLVRS